MNPSEFEISLSVESYDKKTAENCRNFNDAEKRRVSNHKRYQSKIVIEQFEDVNQGCVKIS